MNISTGIPEPLVPYWIPSGVAVWIILPVAEIVRQYVADPPREHLHEVDPEVGDAGHKELYPKQWEDLTVIDEVRADDGSIVQIEKEKNDLHPIEIDTRDGTVQGYECERYDSDTNTAYISWFGVAKSDGSRISASKIRRHEDSTEYLKHEASAEKDVHQRLRNLYPDLVEDAVHNRMNYYIHVVEGEQVPGKKSIRSIINKRIKASELQEYVEEEPDFSDLIDMDDPFEEQSDAQMYKQMIESGGDDDE
ncbi:hypothetical protein [Halolamina sp. C58]|uniref:hypothetical protein n=1 Tax=Halolamina sp. C58 TaxID=3421640 RepID=UPI003EB7E380